MKVSEIKVAPVLDLKPNLYFSAVDIPYLYQKRGALIMYARPAMVLGDDVGLGKTLESIIAYSYMKSREQALRAVVFTEKSALLQWKKEFAWLTPGVRTKIITASSHKEAAERKLVLSRGDFDVVITTYYTIYSYLPYLIEGLGEKYAFFADECGYFKNNDTKMFNQMRALREGATRAYGMTATVIENRLEEAYNIIRIIAPGVFPSRKYFEKKFQITRREKIRVGAKTKHVTKVVGYKNIPEFRKLIEPVFYGRFQTDPEVEQQLPEDVHKDVLLEMSEEQSRKVLEAENGLLKMADGSVKSVGLLPSLIVCQQLVNSPALKGFDIPSVKEESLMEMLSNSLADRKVVIFSKFRTQIERIEALLAAAGIEHTWITGTVTEFEERERRRVLFQESKTCNVMLITKAGQKALNLQSGQFLIFFDLPWSYGIFRQLIGRLKRTGSKHTHIGVYRLLCTLHPSVSMGVTDTIDHHILATLFRKKGLFNAVLGDDTTTIETTDSDLIDLYHTIVNSRKGTPLGQV